MLSGLSFSSHFTPQSSINLESLTNADALSQRCLRLFQLDDCALGFEHLKALYAEDGDFGELFS